MVIPMASRDAKVTKEIIGDGKRIIIRTNSGSLLIIGSGNSVQVDRNDGLIEVVGDGCRVSVTSGCGSINYTGDGGYLTTGSMDSSKIVYKGDGGRIVTDQDTTRHSKKCYPRTTSNSVMNGTSCNIKIPGLNNLANIKVPITKISVINCKCKRS